MDSVIPSTQDGRTKRSKSLQKGKESAVLENSYNAAEGTEAVESEEWAWKTLVDSDVSTRSPFFTKDGNYFFSIVGSAVRIYSASTGRVVSTLSSSATSSSGSRITTGEGHSDVITAAILSPENPFQLITASLDGCVKVWDFLDAVLLRTIDVGKPISKMCAHKRFKDCVFIASITKSKKNHRGDALEKGNTIVYRISLGSSGSNPPKLDGSIRIGKTKAAASMGISSDGAWLVVIGGNKAYVASITSPDPAFSKFVSPERLTCLAFHPTESYFATGDEIGQVRLWYCLNEQASATLGSSGEKKAQTVTMHWHAHAVSAIAFTPNGAYLLSGGEESVLVIWQLHSGKREYVPRLGAPISTIAVRSSAESEEEYLVGLSDGSFVFVNSASLSVIRSAARVRLDPKGNSRPLHSAIPLAFHSQSSTIILPAPHPSSLQSCLPDASAVVLELEVSPSNRISKRDVEEIESSRVEHAVIDPSGSWMATIDKRDNANDFSAEVYLKIWEWDSKTWILNTRIDHPHEQKDIVAIAFSPEERAKDKVYLMSVGLDSCVKTWCPRTVKMKGGKVEDFWINRASFSLRTDVPTDGCWSADGTLLAVSSSRQISLFNPESSIQLMSLASPDTRRIERVCFVGSRSRYLVASGKQSIVVWDLITRRVLWRYHSTSEIARVIAHPIEDIFVVVVQPYSEESATRSSLVLHFKARSKTPIATKTLPFRLRAAAWNTLHDPCRTLIGITTNWTVVECGERVRERQEPSDSAQKIDLTSGVFSRRNLFQDMFGKSAFEGLTSKPDGVLVGTISTKGLERSSLLSIFDKPSYMAPPIETMYSTIMNDFLETSEEPELPSGVQQPEDLEAEEMAVDEERPAHVRVRQRVVDDKELSVLVDVFRRQNISQTHVPKPKANGFVNGIHNITPGAQQPTSPTSEPDIGIASRRTTASPSKQQVPVAQPSPEVPVGKKRKKSTV